MTVLTANEAMLAQLRGIVEPVEVRDAAGNVLGHYTPVVSAETRKMYDEVKELFDLEEAESVLATERDKGRPLREILHELETSKTG